MAPSLVIVESPAKAKTIKKYLGRNYNVMASIGHIKDLPKSKLGVDVEKGFEPTYVVIKEKKGVIDKIIQLAAEADDIFLALDNDREGEAIAWHIAEEIETRLKKKSKENKKGIHRILFNEITKKTIQESIKKPQKLDLHLFESQQARRILDRLVGYKVSPLLWERVQRGLSAGRVQTVALRLVCEREKEIRNFKSEEYWSFHASLKGSQGDPFQADLVSYQGEKLRVQDEKEAKFYVAGAQKRPFILQKITKKERQRHPTPPFITSKLQQDAARKLGFSPKKTMMLAQQLYEGMELDNEDIVGLITYMRTDSVRVSDIAIDEVRDFILDRYGKKYLPGSKNEYKGKKGAQDAHEAIRPTSALRIPEKVQKYLSKDQYLLYDLIWKRFVASQMTSAMYDQTSFDIDSKEYGWRANGSILRFSGFLEVYSEGVDEKDEEEESGKILPDLKEGETLKLLEIKPLQHFTEPPPRFSEASLIKELEEDGVGRPSTYASIMSNIQDRGYVRKQDRRLFPNDLGMIVNDLLTESFPDIFNVQFTAQMENELDEVEEGKRTYVEVLTDFYTPFQKTLIEATKHMKNIKRQEIKTDLFCPECNSPMIIKWGRRGEFLACTNYPECKYTREFQRDEEGEIQLMKREVTGEMCAKCAGQMIIKSGRFGKFLACSNYPGCKTTRALTVGVGCPLCKGKVVEKRTRKGRNFYGCSNYPKCNFATWDKPLKQSCPQCGSPFLIQKVTKTSGTQIKCPEKDCDYIRSTDEEPVKASSN
ncbi:MAG: DNA topoisomerase I [Deltaproteobacteria bacterium RIFCSPLOWO2_12_FULL_50_11]|nr:MAG: DNA topoisomerase I [Deltaproteobacteria bacterium RIFCSPLOWO2_12_FULL_50_11]